MGNRFSSHTKVPEKKTVSLKHMYLAINNENERTTGLSESVRALVQTLKSYPNPLDVVKMIEFLGEQNMRTVAYSCVYGQHLDLFHKTATVHQLAHLCWGDSDLPEFVSRVESGEFDFTGDIEDIDFVHINLRKKRRRCRNKLLGRVKHCGPFHIPVYRKDLPVSQVDDRFADFHEALSDWRFAVQTIDPLAKTTNLFAYLDEYKVDDPVLEDLRNDFQRIKKEKTKTQAVTKKFANARSLWNERVSSFSFDFAVNRARRAIKYGRGTPFVHPLPMPPPWPPLVSEPLPDTVSAEADDTVTDPPENAREGTLLPTENVPPETATEFEAPLVSDSLQDNVNAQQESALEATPAAEKKELPPETLIHWEAAQSKSGMTKSPTWVFEEPLDLVAIEKDSLTNLFCGNE